MKMVKKSMTNNFKATDLQTYFICGTQDLLAGTDLVDIVKRALQAGITAYQFRDKGAGSTLTPQQRYQTGRQLRQLCADYHVPFIVDDDVQLAQKLKADGIHVGQSDKKITQVINEVGGQMFIGLSCSNKAEVEAANKITGIDYYGCGPVFATGSKADAAPVIGPTGLAELVQLTDRPVVAIGGIITQNMSQLVETGASGAAVISLIAQSPDIAQTVQEMKYTFG